MEFFKFVGLLFLIFALLILGPILIIWSLNIIFPVLAIPYTFETWIAMFILSGAFGTLVKTTIQKTV